jgi:hypothetical protein
MSDSYRFGWAPGPGPGADEPEATPCARCGHRAGFAPASRVLLSPGPLVAALPVHWLHQAGFDYSPGARAERAQLTANTSWR